MNPNNTQKSYAVPVTIAVVVILVIVGIILMKKSSAPAHEIFNIASTTPITTTQATSTVQAQATSTVPAIPVLTSVVPTTTPQWSIININGKNLAGFEGDLIVNVKRLSDGKSALIHSIAPSSSTHISIRLAPPCQKGETVYADYSGMPSICNYFEFTPGTYEVSTSPWGKLSNTLKFTVTAYISTSTTPTVNVVSPNGGEVYKAGYPMNIKWNTVGLASGAKVYIAISDYSTPSFSTFTVNAGETPATQGQYNWVIPSGYKAGTQYKISVYTDGQADIDSSDSYFTITN